MMCLVIVLSVYLSFDHELLLYLLCDHVLKNWIRQLKRRERTRIWTRTTKLPPLLQVRVSGVGGGSSATAAPVVECASASLYLSLFLSHSLAQKQLLPVQ